MIKMPRAKEIRQIVAAGIRSKVYTLKEANRASNEASRARVEEMVSNATEMEARDAILNGKAEEFFRKRPEIPTTEKGRIYIRLANVLRDKIIEKMDWAQISGLTNTAIDLYMQAGMRSEAERIALESGFPDLVELVRRQ